MSKADVYYAAMLARDSRFDGKFFVGVKTTGIYCRPICPAKPKRENVEFFESATAAEKTGYRPCLRCRPESAPLSPVWSGKSSVVSRALRVIATRGFIESSEEKFAGQFGVTARHLRRLFVDEVGQTPKQIAFNNRLNFARKLITESNLPMTAIALTAGFSSLRRFNDAFLKRFKRAPTVLRKKREREEDQGITLGLSYRPPFDWDTLLAFYRSHLIAGVETVTEEAYARVFRLGKTTGFLEVTHDPENSELKLQVWVDNPSVLFTVVQKIRRMFDLDSDPLLVANAFRADRFLNSIWKKYPGLRLARGWDPYESAIHTVLGQLVSVDRARGLVKSLVESYGEKTTHPLTGEDAWLFPAPKALAVSDLSTLGTTTVRKRTIREISRRVESGELDLGSPQDSEVSKNQLLEIPGIGPWSAEYINMRALGDVDAFPGTDLILKRAIEKHPDLDLEKLRPWRSYVAVYLWKHYAKQLSKVKRKKK